MRFVLLNDVHLYKGPVSRIDDYESALFSKLEQVAALAQKVGAAAVLISGDIFHQKTKTSYETIRRMIEWGLALKSAGIPVLVIAGNHDLQHDRLDSLPSQPLGILLAAGAMVDVGYTPYRFGEVVVVGIPYPDATQEIATFRLPPKDWERAILMLHTFATVEGGSYFGERVHRYADLAALGFDVYHFGHDHTDHSVTQIGNQFFVNIGALSRGSLAQDQIERDVKVVLVAVEDTATMVQQIRLQVAPASDVFDLALHAEKQQERREIEAFVADLSASLGDSGPHDFHARLGQMDLPEVVRTRVQAYIDAEEHG